MHREVNMGPEKGSVLPPMSPHRSEACPLTGVDYIVLLGEGGKACFAFSLHSPCEEWFASA